MSSMNYVARQLEEMGLTVAVEGGFILAEDPDLDFSRDHDGVHGISRWLAETKEEYEMAIADLLARPEEDLAIELDEDGPQPPDDDVNEEPWTYEEAMGHPEEGPVTDARIEKAQDEAEEFTPAPPEKKHIVGSAQLELAKELNSPKEIAQANDDQDRGGIPNPEDYTAAVVLVKGQRFMAPEGWKIRERRLSGKTLHYGSIYQTRKTNNQATGSSFSLVRDL